jgi:uncharacterized membrane protein YkoI
MKVDNKWITRITLLSLVFFGAITASSVTASAQAKSEKKRTQATSTRKTKSNIPIENARKTALKHASGTVESEKLETRNGKPVYAFEIKNSQGNTEEVWINARTGRMVRKSKGAVASNTQGKMAYTKKKTKH